MFKTIMAVIGSVLVIVKIAVWYDGVVERKYKAKAYDEDRAARNAATPPPPPPK